MATEKRLIDANALEQIFLDENRRLRKQIINDEVSCEEANYIRSFMPTIEWARKTVHGCPTVEAVEVVHGQWFVIEDDYFDLVELKCSACGESYGFEDYEDCIPQNYHYCPNCGAKMDGDGNA